MKRMFFQNLVVKISCVFFYAVISTGINAAEKNQTIAAIDPIDGIVPMLGGLAVILAVIFGLAYLFKKFSGFNIASQNIRVLETQVIGHKERIMIIKVREQQFLIGVTGQSISQLGELESNQVDSPQYEKSGIFNSEANATKPNQNSAFSKIMSTLTYTRGKQKIAAQIDQETVK